MNRPLQNLKLQDRITRQRELLILYFNKIHDLKLVSKTIHYTIRREFKKGKFEIYDYSAYLKGYI